MDNKTQNMSNYKLLKEDDEMFHFQHPAGATFKVAKHALSGPTIKKIKGLYCGGEVKGYADGGEVDDDSGEGDGEDTYDTPAPPPALALEPPPQEDMTGGIVPTSLLANPSAEEAAAVTAAAPVPNRDLAPAPAAAPIPADYSQIMEKIPGMKEQMQGYQDLSAAKGIEAESTAKALANYTSKLDQAEADRKLAYNQINIEQDKIKQDYLDAKIDPKRAIHNMGTGNKIMAAIGIALGGMGSKPNEALAMFEKFINNDIDAQKTEIGKKLNLYNFNLQKYKNADTALEATRLNLNSILQAQILASASKSGSAAAKANAQVLIGGLKAKAVPLLQSIAMQQAQAKSLGIGSAETDQGGLEVGKEPMNLLTNDKYRQHRVVVGDRAYQANSAADAEKMKNYESLVGPVVENVRKLSELARDPSTKFAGTPSNNLAHALMQDLTMKLPTLEAVKIGSKRVKVEDLEAVQKILQDPTRMDQAFAAIKNNEFFKRLADETESVREHSLIGYKGLRSVPFKPMETNQVVPLNKGR